MGRAADFSNVVDDSYFTSALAAASMRLLELRLVKTYPIATPAAGAELSIKVPGGVIWEVVSIVGQLQTSAVASTRRPVVVFTTQDGKIASFPPQNGGVAGTTWFFAWHELLGAGITAGAADISTSLGRPPAIVGSSVVSTITRGIDVGDQWSAATITVREWSETDIVQEMVEVAAQMDSLTLPLVGRTR